LPASLPAADVGVVVFRSCSPVAEPSACACNVSAQLKQHAAVT
jgi:hypothetical protein